MHYIV